MYGAKRACGAALIAAIVAAGCSSLGADPAAFCDLLRELSTQEEIPSTAQIERYERLAPTELEVYTDHWVEQMRVLRAGGVGEVRLDERFQRAADRYHAFQRDECGMDVGDPGGAVDGPPGLDR